MIFGFAAGALDGFLLTAIPNWTGRMPLQGPPPMARLHNRRRALWRWHCISVISESAIADRSGGSAACTGRARRRDHDSRENAGQSRPIPDADVGTTVIFRLVSRAAGWRIVTAYACEFYRAPIECRRGPWIGALLFFVALYGRGGRCRRGGTPKPLDSRMTSRGHVLHHSIAGPERAGRSSAEPARRSRWRFAKSVSFLVQRSLGASPGANPGDAELVRLTVK
jgi:hypothetical protein